jgi:hypothetical protein
LHEVHSLRDEPCRFSGRDVIGENQREKLRQAIMNLENLGKLDELLALTIAR